MRFADPAAWATALASLRALAATEVPWQAWSDEIGMVAISADGPRQVLLQVAHASLAGSMSALRFPAASPGTLAGLACIVGGLRGPSLNFTLTPARGVPVGAAQVVRWLEAGVIKIGVLAACTHGLEGPIARCAVLGRGPLPQGHVEKCAAVMGWLAASPDDGSPRP